MRLQTYYSVFLYKINNHIFHLLPPKNIPEIFLFSKDWKPENSAKSIGGNDGCLRGLRFSGGCFWIRMDYL